MLISIPEGACGADRDRDRNRDGAGVIKTHRRRAIPQPSAPKGKRLTMIGALLTLLPIMFAVHLEEAVKLKNPHGVTVSIGDTTTL